MGYQVAAVGHRISHGLVGVVHTDLEAHTVGQADWRACHHLLPNVQALLDWPLPALGFNSLPPFLHQGDHMASVMLQEEDQQGEEAGAGKINSETLEMRD